MHIAFVDDSQHESLIDLMHEMYTSYSDARPVSRDDVRSSTRRRNHPARCCSRNSTCASRSKDAAWAAR
jgi:hypothetical protein